jgi:hypothetical protein
LLRNNYVAERDAQNSNGNRRWSGHDTGLPQRPWNRRPVPGTLPQGRAFMFSQDSAGARMSLGLILIIILILLLIGSIPSWPYSTGWGYYPSGGLGLILLIVIILVLIGRI